MTSLNMQLPHRLDRDTHANRNSLAPSTRPDMEDNASPALDPGIYIMRNVKSDSIMDLSGGDNKSIIGFPRHGLENQQWEFGNLGEGWYIRSVHTGSYLNIESGLVDGFPVVANGFPASWVVENESGEEKDVFRISWPNTRYSFDLDGGSSIPGTKVNLWSRIPGARHQLWQLERCPEQEKKLAEVATFTETNTPETTTTTTTTTTVTTTTVVTRRGAVIDG